MRSVKTLIIMGEDHRPVSLRIGTNDQLQKDVGLWNVDTNQVLLGANRMKEWNEYYGEPDKQKKFLDGLEKISKAIISNTGKTDLKQINNG